MEIKKLYYGGKAKALTFSYDDGVTADIELLEVFNKYGMKATFNLNSGLMDEGKTRVDRGVTIARIPSSEIPALYKGHELAMHGVRHPHMEFVEKEELRRQTQIDFDKISELFGQPARGLAYPYGTFSDDVIDVLREFGVAYARTIKRTYNFRLPQAFLAWDPTCHHNAPELFQLGEALKRSEAELPCMYVWGHAYEFPIYKNLDRMEKFCEMMAGDDDIWYATNLEIVDYVNAFKQVEYTEHKVINHSDISLWFKINGGTYEAKPHSSVSVPYRP